MEIHFWHESCHLKLKDKTLKELKQTSLGNTTQTVVKEHVTESNGMALLCVFNCFLKRVGFYGTGAEALTDVDYTDNIFC